jgi:hypothetical protein
MLKIIKAICVKNLCYKQASKLNPTGIVVHSTGVNNTSLSRYCDNVDELGENKNNNTWNQATPDGRKVCVHGFIGLDKNKEVQFCQTLPFTYKCWGCGSGSKGSYNNSHIQFEICEDNLKSKDYFEKVYDKAVEVCVYLCEQYSIDPSNIVCHKEANRLGFASSHVDVEHWFPLFGKSMDDFRAEVKTRISSSTTEQSTTSTTEQSTNTSASTASSSSEFKVKVKVGSLNIRSGPSTSDKIVGVIKDKGVYTITKTSGSWGYLKSGKGWINISQSYVSRV